MTGGGPRLLLRTAIAAALLLANPAYAQNRDTDAELKALIPDAALDDPEAWAKAPVPAEATPLPDAPQPQLEPNSPMAEDGQIRLPWPDETFTIPELVSLEPDPDIAAALAAEANAPLPQRIEGEVLRLSSRLALVFPSDPAMMPMRRAFADRFAALSTVKRLSGEGEDNIAQLSARARTDGNLLRRMLRIYGYYDGEVVQTIGAIEPGGDTSAAATAASPGVRFDIAPGPRYRFGAIDLGDLPATGSDYPALRTAFGIQTGDPLDNDRIVVSRIALDTALGESGYAFAKLGEPELVADHRREEGDLSLPVTNGGRYRFGGVVSNLPDFLPGKHLATIARFETGDLYQRSQVEDLRKAIIATGLVSSVALTPRQTLAPQGEVPGEVALDVAMTKAPLRTIAGAIGYDSGEGFRIEASWEHRNLFPPEGMLRVRGVAGTKEQLAGVTFRRNNFRGRDQVLTFDLYGNSVKRLAYVARTVAFSATFEKLTTLIFQKPWVWSAGLEAVASNEREGDVQGHLDRAADLLCCRAAAAGGARYQRQSARSGTRLSRCAADFSGSLVQRRTPDQLCPDTGRRQHLSAAGQGGGAGGPCPVRLDPRNRHRRYRAIAPLLCWRRRFGARLRLSGNRPARCAGLAERRTLAQRVFHRSAGQDRNVWRQSVAGAVPRCGHCR